jgi:hypothetical protein
MSFDLAVGLHRSQLDQISADLYQLTHDELFTGSKEVEILGTKYTVAWDIKTPATFDLSQPAVARTAFLGHLAGLPGADEHAHELLEGLAAASATFSFTYQTVAITLTTEGHEAKLELTLTAHARLVADSDGSQSIEVFQLTAPPVPDKVENLLIQEFIVPEIKKAANVVFGAVKIPPLAFPGIPLSAPVPFVQNEALIAIANLAGSGVPPAPEPGTFPWPQSPFFLLLGNRPMQAATAAAIAKGGYSGSGSSGDSWFGASWRASISIVNPQVSIDGAGLELHAEIAGNVAADINVFHVPIGVGFKAYAQPNPRVLLSLEPKPGKIVVRTREASVFTLLVVPSGSVPEIITAAMLEPIVAAVGLAAGPTISGFLKGLEFGSMEVPAYKINIGATNLTATPTGLTVANAAGMLALEGTLAIGS